MSPTTATIEQEENTGLDVAGSITEACTTIGEGVVGLVTLFDILRIGLIGEDQEAIPEEIGADTSAYKQIAAHFTVFSAFAYLLFVFMQESWQYTAPYSPGLLQLFFIRSPKDITDC